MTGTAHHGGLLVPVALLVTGALGLLWLTVALATALFGAGWTPLSVRATLAAAPHLPSHLGEPRLAFGRGVRGMLPGPVPFYSVAALIATAVLGTAAVIGRLVHRAKRRFSPTTGGRSQSARWASWWELRPLRVRHSQPGRLTLGRQGHTLLAGEERQSVIVLAPSQSGKTTGLAVPALLEWSGPAVATSVKSDLLADTFTCRHQMGETMVFDPAQVTQYTGVSANPLRSCADWRNALRVAHWLVSSARPRSGGGLEDADYWYAAAEKLLAPMLFAAARGKHKMEQVVGWLDRGPEAQEEIRGLLWLDGNSPPELAWEATWHRDERSLASVFTTAETVLAAFADPLVVLATQSAEYTPGRLLSGDNTLYLCAPAHEQERLRPLFSMMIRELLAVVYESVASDGKPIDPPLLLVLDEAANIAPIPELDAVASTGAGHGIQLLSVFQDFAQIEARYGARSRTIVNNHRAKVFGTGLSDPETLAYVSRVTGAGEFEQRSETAGELGRSSTTQGTTFRELTPANVVREFDPGSALLVYGHLPPAKIRLRPWYRDRKLRALKGSQHSANREEAGGRKR